MSDYLEREDLESRFCHACRDIECPQDCEYFETCDSLMILRTAPAADVRPAKHGHWIRGTEVDPTGSHGAECSVCGGYTEDNSPYCGCCGAKMDDELQREEDSRWLY